MTKVLQILRYSVLEIILVILCLFLVKTAPNFLTQDNLLDVLSNVSVEGIVALGMTIVIISGEIDLSVGSAAAWSACWTAWLVKMFSHQHVNITLAIILAGLIAISTGMLIGLLTGWLRMKFGVPTFITTLAWFSILRSAARLLTGGFSITPFPDWFNKLGSGFVLGVPFPAILLLLVFGVVYFLMNHTPFGRAVYAVGGNAEAARLSGIRVKRIKIITMAIVAALAAFAGIIQASKTMAGNPESLMGMELDVIAAVIIGGTSLMGGSGKVWGTLIGLVFLGVLANGMTLRNDDPNWQGIATGVLILVAVLLNMRSAKRT